MFLIDIVNIKEKKIKLFVNRAIKCSKNKLMEIFKSYETFRLLTSRPLIRRKLRTGR